MGSRFLSAQDEEFLPLPVAAQLVFFFLGGAVDPSDERALARAIAATAVEIARVVPVFASHVRRRDLLHAIKRLERGLRRTGTYPKEADMAGRSTLDPENFPARRKGKNLKGKDTRSLGPSDSSDSGSDLARPGTDRMVGDLNMDDNSDRHGTGEHLTAGKEPRVRVNADRDADRVVDSGEAGLGRGLDQAEEGRLGVTDEELEDDNRK